MRNRKNSFNIFIIFLIVIVNCQGSRERIFVERGSLSHIKDSKDTFYKKRKMTVSLPISCYSKESPLARITPYKVSNFIKKSYVDFRDIFTDIPTFDTLKTITAFVPFYLIGRKVDDGLHKVFYDADNHKNINQPPKYMEIVLNDLFFPLPFIALGSLALLHKDPYERRTSQVFAMGVFATWATKSLIKSLKVDAGLRPLNEHFDPDFRVHGGNPSGHTALAAFMATYYGFYKGKNYGIPLGLYTGLVGALAVTVNRHYFSQLVAGAGLGVMFGIAAHKVRLKLDNEIYENRISFGMTTDCYGATAFGLAYNF